MADVIPEGNTRETDNFLHLPVGYHKIIVTNNWEDVGSIDGIDIMHITDFLTRESWGR